MHAMKRGDAVCPFLRDGLPTDTVNLIARAPRIIGAHLKAGRKNNAVNLVKFAVQHNAFGVYFIDAAPARIDKRNIGAVEGLQIFIVKTGAFTELAIIGFERFCRVAILDQLVDAGADRFHFAEISQLHFLFKLHVTHGFVGQIFFRALAVKIARPQRQQCPSSDPEFGGCLVAHGSEQQPEGFRPSVINKILLNRHTGHERFEIAAAGVVPAGFLRRQPIRVGGLIVTQVNRRWRALKHIKLRRRCPQMRHALNGRGTGADNGDALVFEPVQTAIRMAARIAIIPAAGVKCVALETANAVYRR